MTILRNTLWLMMAQGVGMLGPLVMVPFLARSLGPDGWAPVLAAQALAAWLIMILDYASDLSGTRDIARSRHEADPHASGAVVFRDVLSAKLLLLPVALGLVIVAHVAVPVLRAQSLLVASALALAVCRGLNPFWYFQGIERVRLAASIDAAARALAAVAVIVVVREPADGWLVLAMQALFSLLEMVVLTVLVAREIRILPPASVAGVAALRRNFDVFGIRAVGGVYVQASTLLLGLTAPAAIVAVYGGAERIVRAGVSMIQPVTQAVLPRVSYLHAQDASAARAFIEKLLIRMGLLGLAGGGVLYLMAPWVVPILLGDGYSAAIPVMRTLAALAPILAISTVLWTYWALPFGRERLVLVWVGAAAVMNLALIALLTPRYGAVGMCVAVIAAELLVVGRLAVAFAREPS